MEARASDRSQGGSVWHREAALERDAMVHPCSPFQMHKLELLLSYLLSPKKRMRLDIFIQEGHTLTLQNSPNPDARLGKSKWLASGVRTSRQSQGVELSAGVLAVLVQQPGLTPARGRNRERLVFLKLLNTKNFKMEAEKMTQHLWLFQRTLAWFRVPTQ